MPISKRILRIGWLGMVFLPVLSCTKEMTDCQTDNPAISFQASLACFTDAHTTKGSLLARKDLGGEKSLVFELFQSDRWPQTYFQPPTRGAAAEAMYPEFQVFAYRYSGSWDGTQECNYIDNQTASPSGGKYHLVPTTSYWTDDGCKMKFFAYAPGGQATVSTAGGGAPVVSYTPGSDVSQQRDLVEAVSAEYAGNYNADVALSFSHILSGIRFESGNAFLDGLTITSVSLSGLYPSGTHALGSGTWTPYGSPVSCTLSGLNVVSTGAEGDIITDNSQLMLVIPQTLPQGASLTVTFSKGGTPYTITADVSGWVLQQGKLYTVKINLAQSGWIYQMDVANGFGVSTTALSGDGGAIPFQVSSFRRHWLGHVQAVPWTTSFSTDGGISFSSVRPGWITSLTESGAGNADGAYSGGTAVLQVASNDITWSSEPENVTVQGSPGHEMDLSTIHPITRQAMGRETANCYIITAPGYYSIPCVYGNGVRDGTADNSGWHTTLESNTLQTFRNAYDVAICSSYIATDVAASSHTLQDAVLCWQDVNGMLSNVTLHAGGTQDAYITFQANPGKMADGNAVIALRDEAGTVVWSWHIWAYCRGLESLPVTNAAGRQLRLLNVDLGQKDVYAAFSKPRTCIVRFQQTGTDHSVDVLFTRNGSSSITGYANTYYQWGRKDPMLPGDGSLGTLVPDAPQYNAAMAWKQQSAEPCSFGALIQHPNIFFRPIWNLYSSYYYNLWDTDNTVNETPGIDSPVVKTIYDPCPAGFHVPQYSSFTAFSTATAIGGFNKGYLFKRNPSDTQGIFFPACGQRSATSGQVNLMGSFGYHWMAVPRSTSGFSRASAYFLFTEENVFPQAGMYHIHAYAIRPEQ